MEESSRERWLLPRLARADVLPRVARHSLVRPITHGARVPLPQRDPDQRTLFEEQPSGAGAFPALSSAGRKRGIFF